MNPTHRYLQQTPTTSLRANPSDSLRHYRRKVTHQRARSGFIGVATRAPVDNFTHQISQRS